MSNTSKIVLVALALFLVVDGSLYYRYNRLLAQSADPLAASWSEPASANPIGKDAAGAQTTTEDSVRATVRVSGSPSSLSIWTGNAGAVEAQVDGRDLGTLGADGEVLTREFAAQPE
jgi:hypothetical protein